MKIYAIQSNLDLRHPRLFLSKENRDKAFKKTFGEYKDEQIYQHLYTEQCVEFETEDSLEEEKKDNTWREDYSLYLRLVEDGKQKLLQDNERRSYMEDYYPNIDYDRTLEKMVEGFWGTEDGWQWCKKHRKSKKLDFYSTLKKNMDDRKRIVYKPFQQNSRQSYQQSNATPSNHLTPPKELKDGTFIKNRVRFYKSKKYKKSIDIPIDAPLKPIGDNWEFDKFEGWIEMK